MCNILISNKESELYKKNLKYSQKKDSFPEDYIATIFKKFDDTTPVAQEVHNDTRRRMKLAKNTLKKPQNTRILAVANQKGGVGKTTTTVNIAASLAKYGMKVLVIDIDPQGNASTALGIEHHSDIESIYDVLIDNMPLEKIIKPCKNIENLLCAPATIHLAGAEIELVSLVAREQRLKKSINKYIQHLKNTNNTNLDYILIDCPPSLGLLTVNAFVASKEVFIPIQCEYYALEGLSQLIKNINLIREHLNSELTISTILLTMYDPRTNLAAQVVTDVRKHFPKQVLKTMIPRAVRISEAPSYQQTVITYDPTSNGSLAYLEAAVEINQKNY